MTNFYHHTPILIRHRKLYGRFDPLTHLAETSTQVTPGAHAVMICDGAGGHQRGKQLQVPDNITLLTLPAYTPELNPMENIWDYLRQNELCAQVWDTYDDIVQHAKRRGTS